MTTDRSEAERSEPPELPLHLLAELDAGALEPGRAAEVRAAAAADPDAAAALAALAVTRRELRELADPPVPPEIAARWDAALAAEAERAADPGAGTPAAVIRPRHAGRRTRRGLLAAAVLAAAAAGVVFWGPRDTVPPSPEGVDLVGEALASRGDLDVGALADPARRAACLRAVAPRRVALDAVLLGGREVVVDGRAGVLLLFAGSGPGHLHVVVVDPACGPEGGELLRELTIGG